jgi:hypothetical protein
MNATTVAVDLAENEFELTIADAAGKVVERRRLSRTAFTRFFSNRPACIIPMEACGTAHGWARLFGEQGHAVQLLPAQYVRPYVRRNKTDRADASALLEAALRGYQAGADQERAPAGNPPHPPHSNTVDAHAHGAHQHVARQSARVRDHDSRRSPRTRGQNSSSAGADRWPASRSPPGRVTGTAERDR